MKKQFIILVVLSIISLSSWSQGRTIKTITPCSDEVLFKTPGKWFKYADVWQTSHIGFNTAQQQEVSKRVDQIHTMMQQIYPEPIGVDVAWHRTLGYGTFGEQVKYVKNSEGDLTRETLVEKPIASLGYVAGYFRHFCGKEPNEIWSGYPGETGTWFEVYANALTSFAAEPYQGTDNMLVEGYPVRLRQPLKQKFDGYELFFSKANVDNPDVTPEMYALIHRKAELPYISVTRKQYLEACIPYLVKWHDEMIKGLEQMPLTTEEEQGTRKEQLTQFIRNKEAVLKRYKDALDETTKQGLINSPAIIPVTIYNQDEYTPIFVEENIGWMVVIENPKYMRKDLPKYVPQFFVVRWYWNYWKPQADVGKLILEKFPFDKLQAMIDK